MDNGTPGWFGDVRKITHKLGIPSPLSGDHLYELDYISKLALEQARKAWEEGAKLKPKLRTYIKIAKFDGSLALATTLMPRYQRSLISKLLCGILPLENRDREIF